MGECILENFIPQVDFSLSHTHHLHEDITYFLLVSVIQSTKQPSKDPIHYTSNGLRAQNLTIIVLQIPFHHYTLSSWEEKKMSNQHFFNSYFSFNNAQQLQWIIIIFKTIFKFSFQIFFFFLFVINIKI